MAKFTLSTNSQDEDVQWQLELAPPPTFKTIDDATDWALSNFPYGVWIEIHDGRGTLRARGSVAGKIEIIKIKERSDKGKSRYLCDCEQYDYCRTHGSKP